MMWMNSLKTISRLEPRPECLDIKIMSVKTASSMRPRAYGWIEFPAWALSIPKLAETIDAASHRAKEYEHHGGLIRLSDLVTNGRFSNLEFEFQACSVPYDCGGETHGSLISWNGWWRMGFRHPVQYEISSIGEQFIPLDEVRYVLNRHDEDTPLHAALAELIRKNDNSPPITLDDAIMNCS